MVYEYVRHNTLRGRFLSEAPLVLISISADKQPVCPFEDCITHICLHADVAQREVKDTLGKTGIWLSSTLLLSVTTNVAISHNSEGSAHQKERNTYEDPINDHLSQW